MSWSFRKTAAAAATLAAAGGMAVLTALPASAGINTHAVQVVDNGDAGYSVTHSEPFANAGATLTPTKLALNIGQLSGGKNTGGLGLQLCDPNNGFGAQIGEVSNGKTMNVDFAFGTLTGAAADNCVGDPLLTNFSELHPIGLSGIPATDTVDVFASFRNIHTNVTVCHIIKHHLVCIHHKVWEGRLKFQAQDETGGFEIFSSPWIHTKADKNLNEAGFGVQQDTNGLSADTPVNCPATAAGGAVTGFTGPSTSCSTITGNPLYDGNTGPGGTGAHAALVKFTDAFVNGDGLGLPPCCGQPPFIFTSTIHEVATTGNGIDANPATTAPDNSGEFFPYTFEFTDYVGNVVS